MTALYQARRRTEPARPIYPPLFIVTVESGLNLLRRKKPPMATKPSISSAQVEGSGHGGRQFGRGQKNLVGAGHIANIVAITHRKGGLRERGDVRDIGADDRPAIEIGQREVRHPIAAVGCPNEIEEGLDIR